MLRRPVCVYRALILAVALATVATLAIGARAGATTMSPRLQPARSSVAAGHGAALATRRALVRQKTSASAVASATRRTEARLRREERKLTPAQIRAAGAAERRIAAQNAGPLPEQPGSALLNPSVAARSAAQPAASGDEGYVDNLGMTGPSGVVSTACYRVCGLDGGLDSGFVYPGETVTVFGDVWYVTPGTDSTATDQIQVTWTELCDGESSGTVASETVSAEALGDSDPPTEASATFPVTGTCGYEPGEANLSIEMTATVVGGGSEGALPIDAYWGEDTLAQLIARSCSPDSAGAAFAQDMVGDPVDTASGEYADTFTDASLKSPGFPLSITRSYSSAQTASGPLGPGWSLPWEASLSVNSTTGNVTFTAENGDSYVYTSGSGGAFAAPFGARSVLASVTGSPGSVTGYTLTAPDHHVLRFDASGQLTAEVDATGRGLSYGYNGSGQVNTITDAAGHVVSLTYNGNLLTQLSLPDKDSVQYGYTGGLLTSETDPAGQATDYGYSSGLLATITDADGHEVVHNIYDSSGRVTSQQNGTGDLTALSYTTSNGLAETDVTDPNGGITTDLYGGGMLLESIDPLGNATEYTYNGYGEQVRTTDPMGNATTMAYDGSGNLTKQTDPLGDAQNWVYDGNNNLLTDTSADDDTTTYTYNAMDEVTSVTNQSGGETTNGYDPAGNLISSTDPRGNVSGASPAAYQTTYSYDPAGLLQKVTNPGGGVTSYTYDAEGNVLTTTDPMNRVTTKGYDADERVTSVTAPDGGIQKSGYDPAGNLVSQTDPDGNSYTHKYDADDRLSQAIDPLGNSVSYGYDGNGNQTSFTDARGIITTTTYNADDQPQKVSYSDGTPGVSYVYDADGNATKVTDGTGTRTMTWDAAGQLTKAAGPGSGAFGYSYDPAGNIASRSYPDGTQMSYSYDSDGQIASLATGAATTSYSYDPAGNLVSTTEPNGVTESRSYDGAGQLTGISDAKGSTVLDSYGLTLNPDGQPSQAAMVANGTAQATRYYGYDSTGRLTSACYSSSGSSACSAGSAGTATGTAPDPSTPGAPSGPVTSGIAGKCMGDSGNSTTAGGKVDIFSCSGGAAQVWTIQSDGTIRINGQCLDVKGAGTANGSLIDHYTCVGQANQQWKAGSSHSLVNPVSGMCLSDPDASTTDGTQLIIANCNGQPQQQWRLPSSSPAPAGALTSGLAGKCLDDASGSSSNGNKIDIYSCNGQGSQNWTVESDGTVRIMGKCLDVKGQGTANSTVVDLYTCVGQGNQVWEPTPNGFLVNPASGKCLDDPGSATTNGTQLNIYTCVAGASNEVWTLPSTTVPAVPTGVQAAAGAAAATVSWTSPSATGGSPLTGFTVTASPGGATASVGPYATTATVAGLTAGTAYTFTVTVSNGVGSNTTAATSTVTPDGETTYAYDQAGNMTSTQADGLTTTNTYNADEELTKAVTASTTTSYGYDSDGEQTSAGSQTYAYNGAGELSQATMPAGTFGYSYDADRNLSETSLNGSLFQGTVWDENATLPLAAEDTGSSGTTTADYLYGPADSLASASTGAGQFYPVADWLGSLTGLTNASGTQVTSSSYSAFGLPSTSDVGAGAPSSSIGYAGSYSLPGGSGLDDMRARDYSPATGFFMTVDPLNELTGQPYIYAGNNPVFFSDPSGLCSWYNLYCSDVQPILRSVSPDYADFCIGAGFGLAVEGCVTMTRDGKLFVSVGGGLSTPGLLASGNVAKINGNVSNCEIDSFVSGWSITGYGGDGVGVGGTWGDVGHWGPGTTSTEAGLTTPGLSAVGTYSWHVP